MSRGVVAAGHPATAEAGAAMLREGGNAVDAAVASVLASVVAESPLTGLGAGGYMLVHRPGEEPVLLDFFVAAPGLGGERRSSELHPVEVDFGGVTQVFNIGAASCGVPGVPSGLATALERYGSMPLRELVGPAARLAATGLELNEQQAYLLQILSPILTFEASGAVYAPVGEPLRKGERLVLGELAATLERFGEEGPEPFYRGEVAASICRRVLDAGGSLGPADLAAYETIERRPVRARFAGREILTNPPPSSGGVLIAYALEILERIGADGLVPLVAAMEQAQVARTREFVTDLAEPGFSGGFLTERRIAAAAERSIGPRPGTPPESSDRFGSTTHITTLDAAGGCASVTCSNGTGSGVYVPGTGIHVNNMLGESDLNPLGFHLIEPGRRLPSMMSPTIVLAAGELELGLGSGGSNRIRSAITQVIVRACAEGLVPGAAVVAPRVHFEAGIVHAEPGLPERELAELSGHGYEVVRWAQPNLFFGGVHAVAGGAPERDPIGAGDPRRGGAVAYA